MEMLNKMTDSLSGNPDGSEGAFFADRPTVYLCLGSDKLVFDCLGPIVGTLLSATKNFKAYVYGTMACPVTALQVEAAVAFIRRFHFGARITVVDSAVGKKEEVGTIKEFDRGLRPALGIDREMRIVGDRSIMGVVATKDKVKNPSACCVKLGDVYALAEQVVEIILKRENQRLSDKIERMA